MMNKLTSQPNHIYTSLLNTPTHEPTVSGDLPYVNLFHDSDCGAKPTLGMIEDPLWGKPTLDRPSLQNTFDSQIKETKYLLKKITSEFIEFLNRL